MQGPDLSPLTPPRLAWPGPSWAWSRACPAPAGPELVSTPLAVTLLDSEPVVGGPRAPSLAETGDRGPPCSGQSPGALWGLGVSGEPGAAKGGERGCQGPEVEQGWEEGVCSRARLLCPRPVLPAAESGPCALRPAPARPAPATPRGDPQRRVAAACGDSVLSFLLQGSELGQSCQAVEGLVSCFPARRPTQTLNTPQMCGGGLPSTRPGGRRWGPEGGHLLAHFVTLACHQRA